MEQKVERQDQSLAPDTSASESVKKTDFKELLAPTILKIKTVFAPLQARLMKLGKTKAIMVSVLGVLVFIFLLLGVAVLLRPGSAPREEIKDETHEVAPPSDPQTLEKLKKAKDLRLNLGNFNLQDISLQPPDVDFDIQF